MHTIALGISLGVTLPLDPSVGTGALTLVLTGLTGGTARPGDEAAIGYTIKPETDTETVQWGTGPGDATYGTGPTPTDFASGDGGNLVLTVTDADIIVVQSAPIRYAEGVASNITDKQVWTVDDTAVNIEASASGVGLTWSYAVSGLPSGVTINTSTGEINGIPASGGSGTATVIATDQYGRMVQDGFTWSAALRAQATAAEAPADQTFTQGTGVQTLNASADFTGNGNSLTYSLFVAPSGVTINGTTGVVSFDTGMTGLLLAISVVVRAIDEYGRTTDSGFSLTIEAAANFTLSEMTDGELEINGATGDITVTITRPAEYAGTYVFDSTDLASGPVNLATPIIMDGGIPTEGKTQTIVPGLWVYDPDNGGLGSPVYQWQADTGGDGIFADIAGATSSSYTLDSSAAGDDVRVTETLADNSGSRLVNSAAVSVAASAGRPRVIFSDDFSTDTTADYSAGGWEVSDGEARMIGGSGSANSIFLNNEPILDPAGYFVRGTLGTVSSTSQPLRLRAKMDANWGSSFNNVEIQIFNTEVRLVRTGEANISFNPSGGLNTGDIYEIQVINNGALVTVLLNGAVIDPSMEDVDVSMIPNTTRVAFGLRSDWGLQEFEAGNL